MINSVSMSNNTTPNDIATSPTKDYNLHKIAIALNNLGCRLLNMNDSTRLSESALLFELALDTEKKALAEYYVLQNAANHDSAFLAAQTQDNLATAQDLQEMIHDITVHLDAEQQQNQAAAAPTRRLARKVSLKSFGLLPSMNEGFTIYDEDQQQPQAQQRYFSSSAMIDPETANYLWTGMMFNTALVLHLTAVEMDMEVSLVDNALEEYSKAHKLALGLDGTVGNVLRTAIRQNIESLTQNAVR